MRSRLINLALVAGMLLLYSCTSDEVAPANDTFDEVIENGGFVPAAKETFSVLDSTESGFETDTATWVCTTKTMKAEYAGGGDDGFALFNPNASVVYPGSMLQGRSLTQATPDVIAVERAGGVISIDVINGNNLAKVEVDEVSKSAISQAANEIIAASNEIIPANFQFSIQEIQSEQQLATALKVDYNSSFADISTELSFSSDREYNRFVVVLNQSYYTLSFDIPTDVSGLFAPGVTPEDLSRYVYEGNPATYISDVTYGQIYYMLVESTSSALEMNTALNSSFNGLVASGGADTEVNYMSSLKNLNIKVFGFGGNARSLLLSIGTTDLGEVRNALAEGTDIRAGKPVSYVVRNIYDNSIVSVQLNTQYDITTCEPISQPRWTQEWNTLNEKIGPVGAMFATGNLLDAGRIFLFNQKGDEFCIATYEGMSGPYSLSEFSGELNKFFCDLYGQFYYVGGDFPFDGIGAGTVRNLSYQSTLHYNPVMIDPDGKQYVNLALNEHGWFWDGPKDIRELPDYLYPSGGFSDNEFIFSKVTALDQAVYRSEGMVSEFFTFFNEGGGFKYLIGSYGDHWEYTLTEPEYSLGSKLINQFQFHGVNAAATIDIGDERGIILANKAGTEFVFVKFDFANKDYLVSGPYRFYQE